jgi:O-antigen ligase
VDRSTRTAEKPSRLIELGLALIVIAVPLAFLPTSHAPFVDVKLVVLLAGSLMLWAATRGPSRLTVPASVWVATTALAGLFGVDWWWSLFGPENTANGLVLLGSSGFLLIAGTRLPDSIRERIPVWLIGTSLAVGAVFILFRLWPETFDFLIPDLSFEGGTMGHPVFLSGVGMIGILATLALERLSVPRMTTILVLLASAMSLSTKRVGWVALAIGLGIAFWRMKPPRRRAILLVAVVAGTFLGWTVVGSSGAGRFTELTTDSAAARLTFTPPMARSVLERPVLGWGPGNVWGAFVSTATREEIEGGFRGTGDAHNIVLEVAVTTGVIGLAAFLFLGFRTVREMWRGPRTAGWAAGGAVGLFVYHLLQPNNVYLTPLMFLLAGMACRASPAEGVQPETPPRMRISPRAAHVVTGVLLAGGLLVSAINLTASVMEQYGKTYAYEGTLRASLQVAPRRVTTAEALALHLALDGRGGDEAAAAEAMALAERTVRLHPWNPGVRLVAADVHVLLMDLEGAERWVEEHLRYFPDDTIPRISPEEADEELPG